MANTSILYSIEVLFCFWKNILENENRQLGSRGGYASLGLAGDFPLVVFHLPAVCEAGCFSDYKGSDICGFSPRRSLIFCTVFKKSGSHYSPPPNGAFTE